METTLLFDAADKPIAWWFPSAGLIFVAIGAYAVRHRGEIGRWAVGPSRPSLRFRLAWSWFMLAFSVCWTTVATWGVVGGALRARWVLAHGQTELIDGVVQRFLPMPYEGHALESFDVGGVHFAYSDFAISPGFNQTVSHGGPLREGLPVRIRYIGPRTNATILRLELLPSFQSRP